MQKTCKTLSSEWVIGTGYSEESQGSNPTHFAPVTKDLVQQRPAFKCKDYINDWFHFRSGKIHEKFQKQFTVYGFTTNKDCYDTAYIAAKKSSWDLRKYITPIKDFITKFFSDFMRITPEPFNIFPDEEKEIIYIDVAAWGDNPAKLSLFFQLLRIGIFYDGTKIKEFLQNIIKGKAAKNMYSGDYDRVRGLLTLENQWEINSEWSDTLTSAYSIHNNGYQAIILNDDNDEDDEEDDDDDW
jgi:hypothetical protein